MKNTIRFTAVSICLLQAACVMDPQNGQTFSTPTGTGVYFSAFTPSAGATNNVQVLNSPTLDPSVAANWTTLGTAVSATSGFTDTQGTTVYNWSTTVTPVPSAAYAARWPAGGLGFLRAMTADGYTHTTFDTVTFNDCWAEVTGREGWTWTDITTNCGGLGGSRLAVVSTTPTPLDLGRSATGVRFLSKKGVGNPTETLNYYNTIGAPLTLTAFRTRYMLPSAGDVEPEVTATYYNDGDLGIGREMHCRRFAANASHGAGVACHVSNYGTFGHTADADITAALNQATSRTGAFATVAMVYEPSRASNPVTFMVYDAAGNRSNVAPLDVRQANTSVPRNCLTCHGLGSYVSTSGTTVNVNNARFLPFDLDSFRYSANVPFRRVDQVESLRKLNALVKSTVPSTTAISRLVDQWYPAGVNNVNAPFDGKALPAGWTTTGSNAADYRAMYDGVVKNYCRTCHISSDYAPLTFENRADFVGSGDRILDLTCDWPAARSDTAGMGGAMMPHAEHVARRFWQSGARAFLVTGLNGMGKPRAGCVP
ncbi:hypothetical protein [Pyxidicoccus xibeiensis]|uniref:hypothetical protein n=1 Tax=Pyxidicoccus xibeiensis TaxID=2906759 RepID=UPI0020A78E8B|nr:hypothetical protein [Pyxidicoccus xibeiensis]MCP3140335.1 hypothetical protein [Pyxidicoccus xibeiensis]